MRVLVPATLAMLAHAVATGSLDAVAGAAYAVTPAAREMHADGDTEELELLAAEVAAAASLRLLAAAPPTTVPARRVVLSVDVPDEQVAIPAPGAGGDDEPELVHLVGPVPMKALASAHVDAASTAPTVAAALPVAAEPALELGALPEGPAWSARDDVEASPLLWYDRTEIDALVQEAHTT